MVLFPGERRRKHDEAACNIREREEREWRRRRLKSQRPSQKKIGIGGRGRPRYRSSWEAMRGLDKNQVRGGGGGYVEVETHQKGGWISVQQQDDEYQPNNNIP